MLDSQCRPWVPTRRSSWKGEHMSRMAQVRWCCWCRWWPSWEVVMEVGGWEVGWEGDVEGAAGAEEGA
jgi:hypothetical protein